MLKKRVLVFTIFQLRCTLLYAMIWKILNVADIFIWWLCQNEYPEIVIEKNLRLCSLEQCEVFELVEPNYSIFVYESCELSIIFLFSNLLVYLPPFHSPLPVYRHLTDRLPQLSRKRPCIPCSVICITCIMIQKIVAFGSTRICTVLN